MPFTGTQVGGLKYRGRKTSRDNVTGEEPPLTAAQWASVKMEWVSQGSDLLRGYVVKVDLFTLGMKAALFVLVAYSVYLLFCESCKDEYYILARELKQATTDAVTGARGSVSGAAIVLALATWVFTVLFMRRRSDIYLVDFATYKHKDVGGDDRNEAGRPVTYDRFLLESRLAKHGDGQPCFNEKSMEFQEKILRTSCIGEGTIFPGSIFRDEDFDRTIAEREHLSMGGARDEASQMMFNAVEQLLEKTKTQPKDIGIIVVNCSLFCPTPSLSAMLVNKFHFPSDVQTFNLGGMGCSASPIAVDLARRLLRSPEQRNTLALVVSTENITQNWYRGNDRSMLLSNCLFRCGAAAMLLSNKGRDKRRARFKLLHIVRTHMGQNDDCYKSVFQQEDDEGIKGVRLSKMIMQIAGDALKANITTLGPLTLPIGEQLVFLGNILARKAVRGKLLPGAMGRSLAKVAIKLVALPVISSCVAYKRNVTPDVQLPAPTSAKPASGAASGDGKPQGEASAGAERRPKTSPPNSPKKAAELNGKADEKPKPPAPLAKELPPYVPDFTKAFEWICVHTGGRAVIDAIEKNLSLPPHYLEPSRLSLYKYGNVSSASIWYELELVSEHGNRCGEQWEGGTPPPPSGARRLRKGDRIWQIAFGSGFKCNSAVWQCLRNH